jgi:hypothetical protein
LLWTVASFGKSLTVGCNGASAGFGDVATTPPETRASTSVPSIDAHLSVAFEDIFLSLPVTTGRFMVSSDLEPYGRGRRRKLAEGVLRSG